MDSTRRSRFSILLTVLGVVAGVGLALYLVLASVASHKTVRVRENWAASLGSREDILSRYPSADANTPALELERLVTRLGLDIAPRSFDDRPHPTREQVASWKSVKRELGDYVRRHIELSSRRAEPPPEAVLRYLESNTPTLAAVRRLLLRDEVPHWELQLEQLERAPIPNLLGHLDLQRLLVAEALARTANGDHETAHADVAAGWRLNHSLWDRPVMITQLVSLTIARTHVGVLRLLHDPPPIWSERLARYDYRESFLMALRYEGWMWTQLENPARMDSVQNIGRDLMAGLSKPYMKYCLADASDRFRERVVRMSEVDVLCDSDLSARDADLDVDLPNWNVLGGLVMPDFAPGVNRLARFELDLELTRKLLELEAARSANDGRWPASLPGIEHSRVCPSDRWIYEAQPDGSMSIAFHREIGWPEQKGPILATRFTAEP